MAPTPQKVAVLMGGWSSEREVSLVSGKAVAGALRELGHDVAEIDVNKDLLALATQILSAPFGKPDILFNALHGRGGEDGTLQGFLEILGLPYTHSGVLASAIAMDKPLMKTVVSAAGVRCAQGGLVSKQEVAARSFPIPYPFVIKPTNEGSSVGVFLVKDESDLTPLEAAWPFGETAMIEAFIAGHELTVAILGDKEEARALAVTELKPRENAFYDYESKYSDGKTDHLLPAPLPQEVYDEALRLAVLAYRAGRCHGAARADFRWDESQEGTKGLVFLEMNTQPGMTPLSLLPEQALHAGLTFDNLIQWMLDHPTWPA